MSGNGRATWATGLLYGVALVASAFVLVSLVPVPPHDFWWYVRLGQDILQEGHLPRVDTYSWTRAGTPLTYQSWLSAVLLYVFYRSGGLPLVVGANAASVAALFGTAYWLAWRASGRLRLAALTTALGLLMSSNNWAVRPQMFAFWPFATTLAVVWTFRRQQQARLLLILPLVAAVWTNVHGSFVLGLLLVGAMWAGSVVEVGVGRRIAANTIPPDTSHLRLLGLFLIGMGLATLVNPHGPRAFNYVVRLLTDPPSQAFVVEWQPPRPTTPQGALFLASLVVLLWGVAWAPRRPGVPEMIWLALFAGMGLVSIRYVIWYAAILPLVFSTLWDPPSKATSSPFRPAAFALTLSVLAALPLLINPWTKPYLPLPSKVASFVTPDTPVAAAEWLRRHPSGKLLFNEMGYGSYLIWAVPQAPVFIDTRVELYPLEMWETYAAVSAARYDYEELLAEWGVGRIMADKERQAPLVAALIRNPRWQVVYEDARTLIVEVRP